VGIFGEPNDAFGVNAGVLGADTRRSMGEKASLAGGGPRRSSSSTDSTIACIAQRSASGNDEPILLNRNDNNVKTQTAPAPDIMFASAAPSLAPATSFTTRTHRRVRPIASVSRSEASTAPDRPSSRRSVLLLASVPALLHPGVVAAEEARQPPRDLGEGVRGVDLIPGKPDGAVVKDGDAIVVNLKGRLFAKQGWIFTDDVGEGKDGLPQSHRFTVGAGEVIRGLEIGVLGMKEGGVRRVVCPPGVSYQDKEQQPVPRDFSNRQRLYTTIFNPTRLANGEGDTLSTVIFDIELVRVAK
jgi:hypothetical protein